jgi:hypothetical protein
VLHGIFGERDVAGAQSSRESGDEAARRIACQRVDEPVDVAQLAAAA